MKKNEPIFPYDFEKDEGEIKLRIRTNIAYKLSYPKKPKVKEETIKKKRTNPRKKVVVFSSDLVTTKKSESNFQKQKPKFQNSPEKVEAENKRVCFLYSILFIFVKSILLDLLRICREKSCSLIKLNRKDLQRITNLILEFHWEWTLLSLKLCNLLVSFKYIEIQRNTKLWQCRLE